MPVNDLRKWPIRSIELPQPESFEAAVVFDKTEFLELVHEKVHARGLARTSPKVNHSLLTVIVHE
jgi:hypothetical protein